jgi:site-specific DNA-methyltransferase (adenine-specific)
MTHSIHIDSIVISDNRQRQEFEAESLVDLANSIMQIGLLHAPVMRETPDGLVLVAGERRLRAMGDLWAMGTTIRHNGQTFPPYNLPYVTLGELDELDAEEAELDENLKRRDLSWQERAAAISRLHTLRINQANRLGEIHSVADTAREVYPEATTKLDESGQSLGYFHSAVNSSIILSDHLANPEVAKAKTAKDAMKILKKQEDQRKNAELAERVGKNFNSSIHELHHIDCIDWLNKSPDNRFDVICTDPPYGMGAQAFGDGAGLLTNAEHHYDDSKTAWTTLMESLCPLLYRVAKPQAHAYIFCDIDNYHELKRLMEGAGWYVFRTPLINYKPRSGRIPLPEHGPKRQWEMCLYAIKGRKPVTGVYSDVISTVLEENLTHGAQKPVELYVDLLKRSVRPGDVVLDAFCGTGTIFPAAHQLKCKAVGLEQSAEYYGISVNRLNALDEAPELLSV